MSKYKKLSGSTLKIIALISMLVDHFAASVMQNSTLLSRCPADLSYTYNTIYRYMRYFGRIAFPIYCFLLVEGFVHTRNKVKYMRNLLIFSLISEIPFDLCLRGKILEFSHQNVFFTLALGVLMMYLIERAGNRYEFTIPIAIICGLISWFLKFDYGWVGILLIFVLYIFRYNYSAGAICGALAICWKGNEIFALPAFILQLFYNGKRGINLKYFFYIAYPAHLLIYYFLCRYLLG